MYVLVNRSPATPLEWTGWISIWKADDMEAIDELISAAQTFYDDARANENGRSRSWEHCYRAFRDARTDPSPDYDYLSLHLAFYLASWGMYRGSSFLLQKDYKVLSPIVEEILKPEYDCLFGLACADLRESEVQDSLEKLHKYIAKHFRPIRNEVAGRAVASSVSPVLITKILMGTLGWRARVRQVLSGWRCDIQGHDAGIQPGLRPQARRLLRGTQRPPRGRAARNAVRGPDLSADEAARYGILAGWVRERCWERKIAL